MSYSDFKTIKDVQDKFPITVSSSKPLFTDIEEVQPSQFLQEFLTYGVKLALNMGTEKARSELIVTPVLLEVFKLFDGQISFFSGADFTVDKDLGLTGYCDYIVSRSPEQIFITHPVICMVEAKNEIIKSGYGQCLAEMIAAQKFNQAAADTIETDNVTTIWGAVTIGDNWRFLRLEGNNAFIDNDEYHISQVAKVLGIFQHILEIPAMP